jgi:hypothetical protein
MKKSIFLAIAIFLGAGMMGYAQDNESKAGIRGSVNFSNWYTDELNDNNVKLGFGVGIFYRGYISDNFSIQPELGFSQKGSTFRFDNVFGAGEYRGILNYVELPILFNVHLTDFFHIGAGPYVGTLISTSLKKVDDDGSIDNEESFNKDNFTTFDYGFSVDAGIDFDNVTIGARYNLGLNDVEWDTLLGTTNLGKNSVAQIYIGFMF